MMNGFLGDLQRCLKMLPGIGEKSAQRLAFFLVGPGREAARGLERALGAVLEHVRNCPVCNMLVESDTCPFCDDPERSDTQLCVVQSTQDVYLLENTRQYRGRYFVLGGLLSPIDGITPEHLRLPRLIELTSSLPLDELILALNPSPEGESTMSFIMTLTENARFRVSRLSTGIPFGGDLEYSNPLTLVNALTRRWTLR